MDVNSLERRVLSVWGLSCAWRLGCSMSKSIIWKVFSVAESIRGSIVPPMTGIKEGLYRYGLEPGWRTEVSGCATGGVFGGLRSSP